jgi:hypothetical protein
MGTGFSSQSEKQNIYERLDYLYNRDYKEDNGPVGREYSYNPYILIWIKNSFKPILDEVITAIDNNNYAYLCGIFHSKIDNILPNLGRISSRDYDRINDIIYILYVRFFLMRATRLLDRVSRLRDQYNENENDNRKIVRGIIKQKIINNFYNDDTFKKIASETDNLIETNKDKENQYNYLNSILQEFDANNDNGFNLHCPNAEYYRNLVYNVYYRNLKDNLRNEDIIFNENIKKEIIKLADDQNPNFELLKIIINSGLKSEYNLDIDSLIPIIDDTKFINDDNKEIIKNIIKDPFLLYNILSEKQKIYEECSICFEPMNPDNPGCKLVKYDDKTGNIIRVCSHNFHCECLIKYRDKTVNLTCPLCRGKAEGIMSLEENEYKFVYENEKSGGLYNNVLLLLIISIVILLLCYLLYLIYNKLYYCKFYNNKINI